MQHMWEKDGHLHYVGLNDIIRCSTCHSPCTSTEPCLGCEMAEALRQRKAATKV